MQFLTEEAIENAIIAMVAAARLKYDIPEGCSGAEACRRIGLPLSRAPLSEGTDGLYERDLKTVAVNQRLTWQPRIEFTIFHEIMHFLIDDDGVLVDYYSDALPNDIDTMKAAIEKCCHAGAAEFLAPRQRVREAIAEHGFSVELVELLAGQHGLSLPSAAIQLATYAPVECYVVVCAHGAPIAKVQRPSLYVDLAATPRGMKYPLARYAPIPQDHLLASVWELGLPDTAETYVPFPSGKTGLRCHAEARKVFHRVIAILYVGHPPRKGQLGLGF